MNKDENLHAGHRQRLLDKLINMPHALVEHEIVEALLFYAIPRKDTNPLAHRLLKIFGGIGNLINASLEELSAVDGVGRQTATLFLTIAEIFKRVLAFEEKGKPLDSTEKLYDELIDEFKNAKKEKFLFIMLDRSYKRISQLVYEDLSETSVSVNTNEIMRALVAFNPVFAVLAHNHTGESCYPSKEDDMSTKMIDVLCGLNGVSLVDHVIFKGDKYYSYRNQDRIDKLRKDSNSSALLDELITKTKKKNKSELN